MALSRQLTGTGSSFPKVELRTAQPGLVVWGIINTFFPFLILMLPVVFVGGGIQRLIYLSFGLWIVVAMAARAFTLTIPLGIGFLAVMQVWLGFCTIHASLRIGQNVPFNALDLIYGLYLIIFVQASAVAQIYPPIRAFMLRLIGWTIVASTIVAILQFLRFPPATAYGSWVSKYDVEASVQEFRTVRASGLFPNIGSPVQYTCLAIMIVASILVERRLQWKEWLVVACAVISFMVVQVRNGIPVMGFCLAVFSVLAYLRYRSDFVRIGLPLFAGLAVVIVSNLERFGYLIGGGTQTLSYRREILWPQAWNVLEREPWMGIGIEPAFASWTNQLFPNKWVVMNLMDNGWLVAGAWGGWVGIMLLAIIVLGIGLGGMKLARSSDSITRAYGFGLVGLFVYYAWGMFFGSLHSNPAITAFTLVYAGLALPVGSSKVEVARGVA